MADYTVRIAEQDVSIDFNLAVSMGMVPGFSHVHKFGLNEDVSATFETIWSGSSVYAYLSAATALNISSGDTDDTAAGSGAQQIKIEGLDKNYHEIEEEVILNGQTAVATLKTYLRIHRMTVIRGDANQGIIYAGTGGPSSGVPTTAYGQIPVGYGQSVQAIYTIPSGKSGYLFEMAASSGVSKNAIVRLMVRPQNGVFQTKDVVHLTDGETISHWAIPLKIPQKCDVEAQASAVGASGFIDVEYAMMLVDNN